MIIERRTILITGTSSGIGKITAQYFAQHGWNVAATVRKKEDFFFPDNALHTRNFILDVSGEDQCKKVVKHTIKTFGSLDVLVNNAGLAVLSTLEESTSQSIDDQFSSNLFGPINLTKAVLPCFRQQKSGLIVTVSAGIIVRRYIDTISFRGLYAALVVLAGAYYRCVIRNSINKFYFLWDACPAANCTFCDTALVSRCRI